MSWELSRQIYYTAVLADGCHGDAQISSYSSANWWAVRASVTIGNFPSLEVEIAKNGVMNSKTWDHGTESRSYIGDECHT